MKLKTLKESYSDIDSSNAWDAYDIAIEYLGADELCEALAKAMGTDELASNLAYIFRMYEIPFGDDDEDEDFGESVRKNRKIRRSMQEAGRMVNGKVSELSPQHDARKSFYGKAKVVTDSDGTQILYSYNTPVVEIKDDKVVLKPMWDSSATTLRHVKEFLKQNGFEVGSKAQLAKMYGGANESVRSSRKRSMKESQVKGNYMGIPNVKYVRHNTQSDPGIIYKDMYFNVYDIEDTLWNMFNDYCDETGVICDDDGFEQFVGENADIVYSILDDLIDNGYGEVIDTVPSVGPFKGGWRSNGDVIYGEGCGSKKRKSKKRKSMKESEDQDRSSTDQSTVYFVLRKYYNDYTGTWEPIAFWYSPDQVTRFGRVNIIEQDGNVPFSTMPRYVYEEVDSSYINATKKLTREDPRYDEFREYVVGWLGKDASGDGFDKVVERQRVDHNALAQSWRR